MKILVVDDTPANIKAAEQCFGDHELTVAATYDEAYDLLSERPDPFEVVLLDLLMPAGSRVQADGHGHGGNRFVGQMMPVGFALAMDAVLHGATYVAVVTATNHHDHPVSAMLDRLSCYGGWDDDPNECPARFNVNGATVGYFNSRHRVWVEGVECPRCHGRRDANRCHCGRAEHCGTTGQTCHTCTPEGRVAGKDWGKILARLLGTG